MVRLVKGAYWDSEIKRSQERGLDGYPVYTRKVGDRRLLSRLRAPAARRRQRILPAIRDPQRAHGRRGARARRRPARLGVPAPPRHGRGALRRDRRADRLDRPCRVYAPVGSHEDLLAYLVRRLLENGANTSFVNRIVDDRQPIDEIVADPVARLAGLAPKPHPRIPLPRRSLRPARRNSRGIDLADPPALTVLRDDLAAAMRQPWHAAPIIGGIEQHGRGRAGPRPERPSPSGRHVVEAGAGAARPGARPRRRTPHPAGTAARPASAP